MSSIYVQFADSSEDLVVAIFGCVQDESDYPHQGQVDEDDPRYLAYQAACPGGPASTAEVIAAKRYQHEVAGVVVEGSVIDTSRDGQALVAGVAVAALIDPAYTCHWKTADGFIELNGLKLIAMAAAVRAHVQACFDRERELLVALAEDTYTDDMLEEGWPD